MRTVGIGLLLLAFAVGGAFVLPSVFYPNLPRPRGPEPSEVLVLGSAGVFLFAAFRWVSRHMIRTGRLSYAEHPKPIPAWDQWAYHLDPLGAVKDD